MCKFKICNSHKSASSQLAMYRNRWICLVDYISSSSRRHTRHTTITTEEKKTTSKSVPNSNDKQIMEYGRTRFNMRISLIVSTCLCASCTHTQTHFLPTIYVSSTQIVFLCKPLQLKLRRKICQKKKISQRLRSQQLHRPFQISYCP